MVKPARPRTTYLLGVLVIAWGIQAIVTQSILLREALVLMFGSELAWGIVLFAWLAGVAIGAGIGGRAGVRLKHADSALIFALLWLTALSVVDIWCFRCARGWLGIGVGELLPPTTTMLAAIVLVTPVSAMVGLAFPLACRYVYELHGASPRDTGSLGRVYALESLGSLIGGAGFSFWAVEHLSPVETILFCGVITLAACATLLAVTRPRSFAAVMLGVATLATLAITLTLGDRLNRYLVDRRWRDLAPGYVLRAEKESRYQNLAVCSRENQFTLYCDGQVSSDFPDPLSFAPLAHFWMCQHPSPRRVLVLGGAAEGLLTEILCHPVEHVDYVEPDADQIAMVDPYLSDADRRSLSDARVRVHYVDARYFLKMHSNRYDLVIGRLPEPTSAMRARFYTTEFYEELARAMKPDAVYCMTTTASPAGLTGDVAEYLSSIRATLQRHFSQVVVGWGTPAQILAATRSSLLAYNPCELRDRYVSRGVQSERFDPLWFEGAMDWLDPQKLRQRAAELDAVAEPTISTDLRPFIYVQKLILQTRMTAKTDWNAMKQLAGLKWQHCVGFLLLAGVAMIMLYRLRHGSPNGWTQGAIGLSVASTGFATMALSIVWLFAFQSLYGYVYQRIGWIIALFMAGLVIGCWSLDRLCGRDAPLRGLWRGLITVDILLAGLAAAAPLVLPVLARLQTTEATLLVVEWSVSLMVTATGILCGATFALAGRLQQVIAGESAAAAGSVVAADHAGACFGALLTGIVLVPVLGIPTTAAVLIGMKVVSAAVLVAFSRSIRQL